MSIDLPKILEGFGLSSESIQRVKLGRGVVGKTTYVAIAMMVVFAVAAAKAEGFLLLGIVALAVVVFLVYYVGSLVFASKNPAASLLEGAELVAWQQTEMAAKGIGTIQPTLAVEPVPVRPQIAESSQIGGTE